MALVTNVELDLSTLSSHQIHELTQNVLNEMQESRPLVSELAPISVLRREYENSQFTGQIDSLAQKGFVGIIRARGDGDCFYRGELIQLPQTCRG
jgi:ubiquitin thioesterase protein OTUB1